MGDYVNIIYPHVHLNIVPIKSQPKVHVFGLWENIITRRYRTQALGEHGNFTYSTKSRNLNQFLYSIIIFQYFLVLCFLGFLAYLDLRTQATTAVLRQEVRFHSGQFTRTLQGQQTDILMLPELQAQ